MHDRRGGEREEWWQATLSPLGRHEVDDLYTATLAAALEAGVCVITGTHRQDAVLPEGTFTRLTADLRANDVAVLADLQGEYAARDARGRRPHRQGERGRARGGRLGGERRG